MKLGKTHKKLLLDEIDFAIDKMESAEDPKAFVFYFSAIYAVIQRVFNFTFHPELVHLYVVLSPLYTNLQQKLNQPLPSHDKAAPKQIERTIELSKQLREALANDKSLLKLIENFAVLNYSTNGNGLYLYNKGMIKLED